MEGNEKVLELQRSPFITLAAPPQSVSFPLWQEQITIDTFRRPWAPLNYWPNLCLLWKQNSFLTRFFRKLRGYSSLHSSEWLWELMYSPVSVFHGLCNICRMWEEQKQTRCFKKVAPLSLLNIIIAISHPHFVVHLLYLYTAHFSCRNQNQWIWAPSKQICNL